MSKLTARRLEFQSSPGTCGSLMDLVDSHDLVPQPDRRFLPRANIALPFPSDAVRMIGLALTFQRQLVFLIEARHLCQPNQLCPRPTTTKPSKAASTEVVSVETYH
jgi:hypothetical protein